MIVKLKVAIAIRANGINQTLGGGSFIYLSPVLQVYQ